jgi:hypothetical protein
MIILEQMAVLLHCRAAPGRVYRDELGAGFLEGGDVPPSQLARALEISGVRVQRPATLLARSIDDRVAVHFEHALRGAVCGTEQSVHDASTKRGYAATLTPAARSVRGALDGPASRREHRHGETEPPIHARQKRRDRRGRKKSREEHRRPQ